MELLNGLFGVGRDIGAAQECARAMLIFFYGLIAVRLVGRRVVGQWAALDIIGSIVIGSTRRRALTGSAPLWGTLAATAVVLALHWLLAQAAARSRRLSRLIEGRPTDLARAGQPVLKALRRWSISEADVNEALRARGLSELAEVERLVLEPSGNISALRKRD